MRRSTDALVKARSIQSTFSSGFVKSGSSVPMTYYKSLHVTRKPDDLDEHAKRISTNLANEDRVRPRAAVLAIPIPTSALSSS